MEQQTRREVLEEQLKEAEALGLRLKNELATFDEAPICRHPMVSSMHREGKVCRDCCICGASDI